MPDPVAHYWFGQNVLNKLDPTIKNQIQNNIYTRSLQGPDPWSTIGFFTRKNKCYFNRSNQMHEKNTGSFLLALTEASKTDKIFFSVLAGALCHYCLDRTVHPYIILKSGEYDGTSKTFLQRSAHVRLERAIDSYIIRHYYNAVPWKFSIPKRIFKLKQYPEAFRSGFEMIFREIYGWDNAFDSFNAALKDEDLFYTLMQDPFGITHYLLRLISGGATNYCLYSYFRRDIDSEMIDFLNENHSLWHHPYDPSITSTASVMDLFSKAENDAVHMIRSAYHVIFQNNNLSLKSIYGNSNYSTGFDCEDERNYQLPIYDPLPYKNNY